MNTTGVLPLLLARSTCCTSRSDMRSTFFGGPGEVKEAAALAPTRAPRPAKASQGVGGLSGLLPPRQPIGKAAPAPWPAAPGGPSAGVCVGLVVWPFWKSFRPENTQAELACEVA